MAASPNIRGANAGVLMNAGVHFVSRVDEHLGIFIAPKCYTDYVLAPVFPAMAEIRDFIPCALHPADDGWRINAFDAKILEL